MLPTMAGQWGKFWFLEALKAAHRRLEIDTIIKILIQTCLIFLKNTQKN